MRVGLLIVSAVVGLLAVSTGFADVKGESAPPTIRIAQLSPLVVTGKQFRALERIAIRVATPERTRVRTMRTTRRGTFVARFAAVTFDRCSGGPSVVVTTATGLVAKTRMPQPLCPPAMPSPVPPP